VRVVDTTCVRRSVSYAPVVFAASLTFAAGKAFSNTKGEHRVHPIGGDLHERCGVAATIVARPRALTCPAIARNRLSITSTHSTHSRPASALSRPAVWLLQCRRSGRVRRRPAYDRLGRSAAARADRSLQAKAAARRTTTAVDVGLPGRLESGGDSSLAGAGGVGSGSLDASGNPVYALRSRSSDRSTAWPR
jgi:hypothetical protein